MRHSLNPKNYQVYSQELVLGSPIQSQGTPAGDECKAVLVQVDVETDGQRETKFLDSHGEADGWNFQDCDVEVGLKQKT